MWIVVGFSHQMLTAVLEYCLPFQMCVPMQAGEYAAGQGYFQLQEQHKFNHPDYCPVKSQAPLRR